MRSHVHGFVDPTDEPFVYFDEDANLAIRLAPTLRVTLPSGQFTDAEMDAYLEELIRHAALVRCRIAERAFAADLARVAAGDVMSRLP